MSTSKNLACHTIMQNFGKTSTSLISSFGDKLDLSVCYGIDLLFIFSLNGNSDQFIKFVSIFTDVD